MLCNFNFSKLNSGVITSPHPGALSNPEGILAGYFSSPTVGVCVLDSEARYIAINETLARINGMPAPSHLGKTIRQVLGDLATEVEPVFQGVLSTGQSVSFEFSGPLPTKAEIGHWIVQYFPIRDETAVVTRVGALVIESSKKSASHDSLSEPTERIKDQLQLLFEVSGLLSSEGDCRQVFPRISSLIRRLLRQDYAAYSLQDMETGVLVRQAEDFPRGTELAIGVAMGPETPSGQALRERSTLIFSKEEMQRFTAEPVQRYLAAGLQSLCCIPLLRPGGPIGVLVLGSSNVDAFHSNDVPLLNQLAANLAISLENHRAMEEVKCLRRRMSANRKYLEGAVQSMAQFPEIVGKSAALKRALEEALVVAPTDATVLILGETGTGKELIAHAMHRLSLRRNGAFVKVNCAAIPSGLLESELFGHEKGAFTGAVTQKVGRFELANNGTILLDEVGEIPVELQPKLLRLLQDREFERLGSTRTAKVNVRIVAATNRDLASSVAKNEFRRDLYYRLHVFPITMPPLRERREDIPLLVRHFVRKFSERMNRQIEMISEETMSTLTKYRWPGNVRELENLIERCVILSEGPALYDSLTGLQGGDTGVPGSLDNNFENLQREHIIRVLKETRGVLSGPGGAAERLGLNRTTLQSKMQRLGISREDFV